MAPAPLFTPFFLGPSRGGPIGAGCGAGVPAAAGVFGLESDAFSVLLEAGAAGIVADVAGESLVSLGTGDSSFFGSSSLRVCLSFSGETTSLTIKLDLTEMDLRWSAGGEGFLVEEGMMDSVHLADGDGDARSVMDCGGVESTRWAVGWCGEDGQAGEEISSFVALGLDGD